MLHVDFKTISMAFTIEFFLGDILKMKYIYLLGGFFLEGGDIFKMKYIYLNYGAQYNNACSTLSLSNFYKEIFFILLYESYTP